jgi:transcriptional regulator with XRE-family HTH domain
MSPFAHFLRDARVRRGIRQADLADSLGYDQTYVSALETGAKGPPTPEFVERLVAVLGFDPADEEELRGAVAASERKLVLAPNARQDLYLMLSELRTHLSALAPAQTRIIRETLRLSCPHGDQWAEPESRIRRRSREGAPM